ncbi:MAG: mammalian cell entry protein [Mycobacterium sp.]
MSPRRKFEPGGDLGVGAEAPRRRRRSGLPVAVVIAVVVSAAAIAVCSVVLVSHVTRQRATIRDAVAMGYVRSFMTEFTSPDPIHANAYTDRILAEATGDFAEQYRTNQNEILIGVARSEPTTGTVLDAGVSRRRDDGSIDVLVVTKLTSASPDGKLKAERANRWLVTTKQDGDRWKISSLIPMI